MILSLTRILTLARNTLLEAIRQRVLSLILLFGLALLACAVFFSGITYDQQIKFVKDFGLGIMSIIGFVIALLSTAQLIPQELQNRTIYTILSKPVRRAEFLYGKFLGVVLLLVVTMSLMSLVFIAVLAWQEQKSFLEVDTTYLVTPHWNPSPDVRGFYEKDLAEVRHQIEDPQLIAAILLLVAKLILVQGIALLLSTFATSFIYTVVTTFLIYLAGHLESIARETWLSASFHPTFWQNLWLQIITILIPDFNAYTIVDEILAGNVVPWSHTASLLGYSAVYLLVILWISEISFRYREL